MGFTLKVHGFFLMVQALRPLPHLSSWILPAVHAGVYGDRTPESNVKGGSRDYDPGKLVNPDCPDKCAPSDGLRVIDLG